MSCNNTSLSPRYQWLDVFKGLSIFFIIFAHLGVNGRLAPFVFSFMVHSFFFAGGITAKKSLDRPFKEFFTSKFKRLIVPYFAFGFITIIVLILTEEPESLSTIIEFFRELLIGNRLKLFAVTLWFIPCLFVLNILFYAIARVIKNKWARFLLCFIISFVFRLFSEGNILPWGVDNAVKYLIYYAAGDAFADFLNKLSLNPALFFKKPLLPILCTCSVALAFYLYQFGIMYFPSLIQLESSYMLLVALGSFYAFNGIFLTAMASIALSKIEILQKIGQESFVICLLQKPLDKFVYAITSLFGITLNTAAQTSCLFLAVIFMIIGINIAKPIHKFFPFLLGEKPNP